MAESYGPFLTGTGANFSETQWREFFGNVLASGVIKGAKISGTAGGDLAVTAGGSLSINIATGMAVVYGFGYENDASLNHVLTAADPTNDRIDYIIIQLLFSSRTVLSAVLTGTPASSPVAPTLVQNATTWDVPLAQVRVPHGASSIISGNITDERAYTGSIAPALQGSGSGLNADMVDGLDSTAFALGNAASQHLIVLNRAPTNADGVDGDLIFQWHHRNPFGSNARLSRTSRLSLYQPRTKHPTLSWNTGTLESEMEYGL